MSNLNQLFKKKNQPLPSLRPNSRPNARPNSRLNSCPNLRPNSRLSSSSSSSSRPPALESEDSGLTDLTDLTDLASRNDDGKIILYLTILK